jgi:FemAB-related protein (PEP-CTERM system-associated)
MECSIFRGEDAQWDDFVLRQPSGTFFHLAPWRGIIKQSFGFEPLYLCASESGGIRGVLPLFLVKSLLFGRSLVGMPIGVYGGPVALDDEASQLLIHGAMTLAEERAVRYLEIRGNPHGGLNLTETLNGDAARWSCKDLYFTFLGEIESSDEANLARIPRKQRRMVRQGEKHGLKAIFDNSRLREFYDVYAESVRNLGTPVYGFSYFENLVAAFGERCKLLVIEYEGKVVAGVLSFFYREQVLPFYGGASRQFLHLAPNDFMYWELMRYAASRGYRAFDFGRSKRDTGSYHFKRHWGFEPKPLPYWYYSQTGRKIPDTSPLNPKLQWAIQIWRNLPVKITTLIGPQIVRHLP